MTKMSDRICVTGLGIVSPIGIGKEEFLCELKKGTSGVGEIRAFDTSFSRSKKAGIVHSFNPRDFIAPGKIRRLDRASLFAIAASKLALADAGVAVTQDKASRVGIVLGSGFCGLSSSEEFHRNQVLKGFLDLNPMLFPNTVPNAAASNTSIQLGIRGVNCTLVQSFCTAEAALIFACDQLQKGRADLILAGGVDELSEYLFRGFSDLRLLATDRGDGERSCPYDRKRNGLVLGEGAGILAIETEEHARSRGKRIYGHILSYNLIGRSPEGSEADDLGRSVRAVLRGRENLPLDYISGAGSSSRSIDSLEAAGVKTALGDQYLQVPVSSVKSMTGDAIALGGMRMVADMLSLENGFVPPTINYLFPDPDCDLCYVTNHGKEQEIGTLVHLGISPESCFSSILIGAPWIS